MVETPGVLTITGALAYQACDDEVWFQPGLCAGLLDGRSGTPRPQLETEGGERSPLTHVRTASCHGANPPVEGGARGSARRSGGSQNVLTIGDFRGPPSTTPSPLEAGAAVPPPKYPACRSSSDTPPRTTGSVAAWHCGGQSPRSARPDAGTSRIATGAGRRAHTRPGPHSAHTRIRPANGSPPDTVGRRLRWRIGAETRGDSWERLGGAHAYTTYRGVLKQPEKQRKPRRS